MTYYFYDENFVEALSDSENVRNKNYKEIQLEFGKTKDEKGEQCWELMSDESVIKEVSNLNLYREKIDEKIENIDGISNFSDLKILNLNNNQIEKLPSEIGHLTNLKELYLRENQIKEIPEGIWKLINLEKLSLGNNKIEKLPSDIGNLEKLETLDLGGNQITEISSEIGKLTNFKKLYLENNQISELSSEICNLTNLELLWLNNNQISELPKEIGNLTNLKELDLKNNKLLGDLAEDYSIYLYGITKENKGFRIEADTNKMKIKISKIDK